MKQRVHGLTREKNQQQEEEPGYDIRHHQAPADGAHEPEQESETVTSSGHDDARMTAVHLLGYQTAMTEFQIVCLSFFLATQGFSDIPEVERYQTAVECLLCYEGAYCICMHR